MALTLLLGGARAGKSSLATEMARGFNGEVAYLATATAGDAEMARRIEAHRRERPAGWLTVEEPVQLDRAISSLAGRDFLIVDCLTLWVSNLLETHTDDQVLAAAGHAATRAARRAGPTVAVSNEVGWGIVPANAAARRYRDLLGAVNARWAAEADRTYLVVAGRVVPLEEPPGV